MTRLIVSTAGLCLLLLTLLGFAGCGPSAGNGTITGPANSTPASTPAPGTVDCATAGAGDIMAAVYASIESSKSFTRQEWQYNISISTNGGRRTLKLTGWSPDRDLILKAVTDVAIGCTINDAEFKARRSDLGANYRVTASCAQGYFACGDVCLPNGEICKLTGVSEAVVPDPNANANANANGNSNSNSNGNTNGNSKTGS